MKKIILFLLTTVIAFAACEEVEEVGKYDNWRQRNEAFIDSISSLAGNRFVNTAADADAIPVGQLFAIQTNASTTEGTQYVYCKKLTANLTGERPNYVGWHSNVSTYYYGTLITGEKFDGNFQGYGATDTNIPNPPVKNPTDFDVTTSFGVSQVINGWTAALQFMRMGERWLMYIPYQSAYGTDDSGSIPGYSALTFDVVLDSFAD